MQTDWTALKRHHATVKGRRIQTLFDDPDRFTAFSAASNDLLLDYSKTNIDTAGFQHLLDLATGAGLAEKRDAMFRGDRINRTEDRAVLHTALRRPAGAPVPVGLEAIQTEIHATLAAMRQFAEGIRSGRIAATDGNPFSDVINIGIGGSDLGPVMATLALSPYHDGPRTHFVSNVDGAHLADTLRPLNPQRTLVIIASKTFTTIETMTNAQSCIRWLEKALGDAAPRHLAAVSSATDKTAAFGIDPARVFGFGDYIGGRYSMWGPVGLPVMLAVGPDNFARMLDGAAAMDRHFQTAPFAQNLPVLLALTGIWHNNICGYPTRAVLPYDQRLARLPAYLQQLDMESNGKSVTLDGANPAQETGPIVWGEPGTNGQHAFYQLLHQGTRIVPAEFLIAARGHEPNLGHHHDLLVANCLAQSKALMTGRTTEQARALARAEGLTEAEAARIAPHRSFPGNRPSVTLAYPMLTPFTLGQIVALYEHRVFCEAAIWNINAFDQFGVELGKSLAREMEGAVRGGPATQSDPTSRGLLQALKGFRGA